MYLEYCYNITNNQFNNLAYTLLFGRSFGIESTIKLVGVDICFGSIWMKWNLLLKQTYYNLLILMIGNTCFHLTEISRFLNILLFHSRLPLIAVVHRIYRFEAKSNRRICEFTSELVIFFLKTETLSTGINGW